MMTHKKFDENAEANDSVDEEFEAGFDVLYIRTPTLQDEIDGQLTLEWSQNVSEKPSFNKATDNNSKASKPDENIRAETRVDEIRTVGRSYIAKISMATRSSFEFIGSVLSGCTVHLMQDSSLTGILHVIFSTSIICGLITAIILYFQIECGHFGMMPVLYWSAYTCLSLSESHHKTKRFFHRNISGLFRHNVRELHYSTMLWIRPFFSLYVTAILICIHFTMEQNQDFGVILAEIIAYYVTIHAIFELIFCLAAKSDLQLLRRHLPNQRVIAAIHNTLDIIRHNPSAQLMEVLEVRESQMFSTKI